MFWCINTLIIFQIDEKPRSKISRTFESFKTMFESAKENEISFRLTFIAFFSKPYKKLVTLKTLGRFLARLKSSGSLGVGGLYCKTS
eukprot:UN17211